MDSVPEPKNLYFDRINFNLKLLTMKNNIQHKFFYITAILALAILISLSGCNPQPEQNIEQALPEIRIGYCPTMNPYVQNLAEAHENVIPVLYDNSAAAMQALQARDVQAILIGRTAWEHEIIEDLRLLLMADGLTLIVQQPGFIRYEDLSRIRIFTHEDPENIQSLIPMQDNVTFYDDFDQMLTDMGRTAAVLLRWSQVSPVDGLLVPVDAAGVKITGFRSPHLYYLAPMETTLSPLLAAISAD